MRISHSPTNRKSLHQSNLKTCMFVFIPIELWYIIFRFYLPNYERFKLLFVCKSFYALLKRLDRLPLTYPLRFIISKYYFLISQQYYHFTDSRNFFIKKDENIVIPHVAPYTRQKPQHFLFSTSKKQDIVKLFEKYEFPIHYIQFHDVISFPPEIGNILLKNFRYTSNNPPIVWVLSHNSPIKRTRKSKPIAYKYSEEKHQIDKIFFYHQDLLPKEYTEISDKILNMPKHVANSYATHYAIRSFRNVCIIDVMTSKEYFSQAI